MATAAQIEANRRNAQKSTGPKTERGRARGRRNAITHGMTARTIMPVLPQEDPKELEDRTQQAIAAMKPRNPLELDLVCRAVRLAGEIDRAERVGTAHLAHRVRMAARSGPETVSALELKKLHDLGSKLFSQSGIGPGYPESSADDEPAVIVRRLEESAEGCRWMLARWAELLNVLDRKAAWRVPEMIRFVGLQGKRSIEAHFDSELNSLFHAFDALGHRFGHKFWKDDRDGMPLGYIGGFQFVPYREIAPPPSDETAALTLIRSVIERHVGRLNELLAEHEEIEADEADERYDRAALDCSPEFERHRRYQSARHRKLLRTLETLRKMRKEEFGTGNGEGEKADGKCQVADDRGQMADDECQVAHDEWVGLLPISWSSDNGSHLFVHSVDEGSGGSSSIGTYLSQVAENSAGVRYPRELCGRSVLYSPFQSAPNARACGSLSNSSRSRNSSRTLLWNDSA